MKFAIFGVLSVLALAGCKAENPGQHLGNFKTECETKKGTLEEVSPNNYKCTLPDGSVVLSK
jgi:hypothetical protein